MKNPGANGRYERKFNCGQFSLPEVLQLLSTNPSHLREIYQPRMINNVYYDTSDLDLFYANIDGLAYRTKVRIRWYGEQLEDAAKPTLEIKRKHGLVGTKDLFRLPPFTLDSEFIGRDLWTSLSDVELPESVRFEIAPCAPALINRYRRRYFLSADQSVRVTVDWDMTFHMCSPITRDVGAGEFRDDRVIVEVKYGVDRESEIDRLTAALPFRLSRYSKYVTGVSEASFRVV